TGMFRLSSVSSVESAGAKTSGSAAVGACLGCAPMLVFGLVGGARVGARAARVGMTSCGGCGDAGRATTAGCDNEKNKNAPPTAVRQIAMAMSAIRTFRIARNYRIPNLKDGLMASEELPKIFPRASCPIEKEGHSPSETALCVIFARQKFAQQSFFGGLIAGDLNLRFHRARGCPIQSQRAFGAQAANADGGESVALAAAAQDGIFRASDLQVMNHRCGLRVKLNCNFDIGCGLAPAIFYDDAANENDVGNFIRRQPGVCENRNVEARLPIIKSPTDDNDNEQQENEPGQHDGSIVAQPIVRGNGSFGQEKWRPILREATRAR